MDLDLIRIFVKVIQNGSFSKAAALLKLPKSTVSKSVSRLENETGTKLILRTTRSLSLTSAGRAFYETCLGPVQTLEDALKSLYGGDSILSGLVRVTAPEDLGSHVIAAAMAELTASHPTLSFELHYTDELIDLVKDGFDIAVRIGRPRESSFKIRRAGEVVLVLVASPTYLKGKEKIRQPRDLADHACLTYSDQAYSRWTLRSSKNTVQIPMKARISSNQMSSLLKTALAHGGVALIPHYLCKAELEAGKLVRVLPEWSSPGFPVSILSPLSSSTSARLRISIDRILTSLQAALNP